MFKMEGKQRAVERPPIEVATERDIDAILELMALCMPHLKRTREQLLWQYFEPTFGRPKLYVIRDGGGIVALYSTIGMKMRVNGKTWPARMQLDVMTHPAHRGQGYHSYLIGNCLEEARRIGEISYGLPNEQAEGGFRRTPGFIEVGRIPLRQRRLDSSANTPGTDRLITQVAGELEDFVTKAWDESALPVGVHRDREYLSWRYRKPGQAYHLFRVAKDRGFLALKIYQTPEGERVLHVCDLFVRADSRDILVPVLEASGAFGRERGATRMTAWLAPRHPYAPAFDRFGLPVQEVNRFYFFTAPRELESAIVAPGNWHFTQGDSDVY